MKKMLTIAAIAISMATQAQTPQAIPYQAAARNSSGAIIASQPVGVRFTVRDSIATGPIKYRETHSVTTTPQGLFTANVGSGTPVTGTFSNINWANNAKFLQVEIDPAGGSSYIDMGTQQMMSVPYALNAASVKLRVSTTGDTLHSGGGNYVIVPGISAANCTISAGTITGTATVTAGSTTTLSNTTTGGTWSSSNTGIATVGTSGVVTGVAAGTATISYMVTNSCGSAFATRVVTVNANPIAIGTSFGGGKIAYILQPGDPGYVAGETRGLIAAPSDQSTGIQWGCYGTLVGGTSTAIGSGAANTAIVSAACGTGTAARLCDDLVLGGYSDWYLPSRDELQKLYNNRSFIGGFSSSGYCSSSEYDATKAWTLDFVVYGGYGSSMKNNTYYVRAVRSFSYPEAITGTGTVCVSSTTTLSSATTGGVWSSGNTAIATVNSSGIVSGVAAGTTTISYTVTESSGTYTTTRILTVNALPGAGTITGTAGTCVGATTTLSNSISGGVWSSSNASIATVNSAGIVTGVATGSATISYTITNSCGVAVATRDVTIVISSSIVGITGTGSVCTGGTTTLSHETAGGTWSSANTSVATIGSTGIVTGAAVGTATISYIVTYPYGCGSAVATKVVTVNAAPSAGTITGTATVTAGSTTTLSNATAGGVWSSSNTGIATVGTGGVVTGVAAGTATISYTVTNGCGSAVATRVVTVNAASTTVGSTFGGGIIAYILQPGDPGYVAGETHGLIAAPSDQSTGIQWYNGSYITTGATGMALGTGMANTNAIVTAQGAGSYAAKLCADLVLNGYSDWYLPSSVELQLLYVNRSSIGGFTTGSYWSSSEYDANGAWYVNFGGNYQTADNKGATYYVRAVRSF